MRAGLGLGVILMMTLGCSSRPVQRQISSLEGRSCATLDKLEIHSHRGAWDRPENMMSAFLRAAAQGADFIELDLQISREDELVVAHDFFVKPECRFRKGRPRPETLFYRQMSLAEIRELDCGTQVKTGQAVPGEGVSTLAEVMEALKNHRTPKGRELGLNIEIKYDALRPDAYPNRELYVRRLLEVLDRSGYESSRIMVQSFDVEILRVLRAKRPALRLSPLFGDVRPGVSLSADLAEGMRLAKSMNASLITPHFAQISPGLVSAFHEQGMLVIPWTVNHPEVAAKVIDAGVDGVITDHPEWFEFARAHCR